MSLSNFLRSLQSRPKGELFGLNEANSRRWIIEPVLQKLGWNTEHYAHDREVIEEYAIRGKRVDYCLIQGANKVFIEAKKPSETLVRHQPQLFNYVYNGDARSAILTNCLDWWFYLPSAKEPFLILNLLTGDPDPLAESFISYLSKANILSGSAFDGAEIALEERQRITLVEEGLPQAWKKLIFREDEKLVELLSDLVEQNEGRRPLHADVVNFLVEKRKSYEPIEEKYEKKRLKNARRAVGSGASRKPTVANGKQAIKRWNLPVKQARFHQDGKFYNTLQNFPAALCDPKGYIIFETEEAYKNCNYLKIGAEKINVKGGKEVTISNIPGYVFSDNPYLV